MGHGSRDRVHGVVGGTVDGRRQHYDEGGEEEAQDGRRAGKMSPASNLFRDEVRSKNTPTTSRYGGMQARFRVISKNMAMELVTTLLD